MHTVAVVNGVRTVGQNPLTGGRGDSEEPGTGCTGRWRSHAFILTAKHVLENATPGDIRVFSFPNEDLPRRAPHEIRSQDIVDALPVDPQRVAIHRCDWEDLALLSGPPESFPVREFFDAKTEWIDPGAGEVLHCIGFPTDSGFVCEKQKFGQRDEWIVAVYPTLFSASVLSPPTENDLKYKITAFDHDRHFLVPFDDAAKGKRPHGISGAAVWWESGQKRAIWRPDFKFAGVCVCCYKHGAVLQIVKASVVRRFLQEVFGPAGA